MEDQYPIILVPKEIEEVQYLKHPIPSKPSEPMKPKRTPIYIQGYILLFFVISVIIGFVSSDFMAFVASGVISIIILIIILFNQLTEISKRYNKDIAAYKKAKKEYPKVIKEWESEKQRIRNNIDSLSVKFRKEELKRRLSNVTKTYEGDTARAGRSEQVLYQMLKKKLPYEIFQNKKMDYYYPDIAFINKETNLHIDIEIDEPYEIKNNDPIHYENIDASRNKYFLGKNWIVIRFAEEQIVNFPEECSNVIIHEVKRFIPEFNEIYDEYLVLPSIKQWTKEEANKMASQNYRNTYSNRKNSLLKEQEILLIKLKQDEQNRNEIAKNIREQKGRDEIEKYRKEREQEKRDELDRIEREKERIKKENEDIKTFVEKGDNYLHSNLLKKALEQYQKVLHIRIDSNVQTKITDVKDEITKLEIERNKAIQNQIIKTLVIIIIIASTLITGVFIYKKYNAAKIKKETLTTETGEYKGKTKNNQPHGKGIMKSYSGFEYKGDFINGKLQGTGVAILPNGDKYEGEFYNDEFNGKGILYYSEYSFSGKVASKYQGGFKDGTLNGEGILYFKNGDKIKGFFKDGHPSGTYQYITNAGKIYEEIYLK